MTREFKALVPKNQPKKAVGPKAVEPEVAIVNPETGETGGRGGLDPVRYGDWEIKGRCVDF